MALRERAEAFNETVFYLFVVCIQFVSGSQIIKQSQLLLN